MFVLIKYQPLTGEILKTGKLFGGVDLSSGNEIGYPFGHYKEKQFVFAGRALAKSIHWRGS